MLLYNDYVIGFKFAFPKFDSLGTFEQLEQGHEIEKLRTYT